MYGACAAFVDTETEPAAEIMTRAILLDLIDIVVWLKVKVIVLIFQYGSSSYRLMSTFMYVLSALKRCTFTSVLAASVPRTMSIHSKFVGTSDKVHGPVWLGEPFALNSTVSSASATNLLFSTSGTILTPLPATTGTAVTGPLTALFKLTAVILVSSCDAVDADDPQHAQVGRS